MKGKIILDGKVVPVEFDVLTPLYTRVYAAGFVFDAGFGGLAGRKCTDLVHTAEIFDVEEDPLPVPDGDPAAEDAEREIKQSPDSLDLRDLAEQTGHAPGFCGG